jgi:hypothetical protein
VWAAVCQLHSIPSCFCTEAAAAASVVGLLHREPSVKHHGGCPLALRQLLACLACHHHLLCYHCIAVSPPSTTTPPHHHHHRKRPKADSGGWDAVEATPAVANRWDATPGGALGGATPGPNSWDATPGAHLGGSSSKWDATPGASLTGATPAPRRNRWDETPAAVSDLWGGCGDACGSRYS